MHLSIWKYIASQITKCHLTLDLNRTDYGKTYLGENYNTKLRDSWRVWSQPSCPFSFFIPLRLSYPRAVVPFVCAISQSKFSGARPDFQKGDLQSQGVSSVPKNGGKPIYLHSLSLTDYMDKKENKDILISFFPVFHLSFPPLSLSLCPSLSLSINRRDYHFPVPSSCRIMCNEDNMR